jgi:hypothetical protein
LTWTLLRGRLARPKLIGAIIMRRLSDNLGIARHWVVGMHMKTICRSCVKKATQGHTTSIARH